MGVCPGAGLFASLKPQTPKSKKLRNHDGHFFATIATPLLVIQTYQATIIIINDPTTRFYSAICYYHRGWIISLCRIRSTRWWIKIYYSVYVHRIITIRLQWRCIHRLWTIYMYIRFGGTLFWPNMVHGASIHPKHTQHMICIKISSFINTTYTNNILHINNPVKD